MTGAYVGLNNAERQLLRGFLDDEPRIGSLFSGYGGLDMGVQAALGGGRVAWHVEFDDAPSRILAHRFPGIPNYGDITAVDWSTVEPIDVLTGGFPCQDVSLAGLRRGLKDGTRSGLWSEFAVAIDKLRPQLVVIENVRGLLSAEADRGMESDPWGMGDRKRGPALRALGAVLGDLADLGYDARWCGFRAADAGAPHGRFRVFVIAYPKGQPWRVGHRDDVRAGSATHRRQSRSGRGGHAAYPGGEARRRRTGLRADDAAGLGRRRPDDDSVSAAAADTGDNGCIRLAPPHDDDGALASWHDPHRRAAADTVGVPVQRRRGARAVAGEARLPREQSDRRDAVGETPGDRGRRDWGPYAAAVERWERVTGTVAPAPTAPTETYLKMVRRRRYGLDPRPVGMRGSLAPQRNLSAAFVEWMMGLPAGWTTAPEIGLTRAQQLKALGNGVVPQQAALAVATLLAAEAAA